MSRTNLCKFAREAVCGLQGVNLGFDFTAAAAAAAGAAGGASAAAARAAAAAAAGAAAVGEAAAAVGGPGQGGKLQRCVNCCL